MCLRCPRPPCRPQTSVNFLSLPPPHAGTTPVKLCSYIKVMPYLTVLRILRHNKNPCDRMIGLQNIPGVWCKSGLPCICDAGPLECMHWGTSTFFKEVYGIAEVSCGKEFSCSGSHLATIEKLPENLGGVAVAALVDPYGVNWTLSSRGPGCLSHSSVSRTICHPPSWDQTLPAGSGR